MPSKRSFWNTFVYVFFLDPARPLEWLNVVALLGYAQLMSSVPDLFDRPAYSAFGGAPWIWAAVMVFVALAQIVAMRRSLRTGPMIRFVAMAVAAGLWTVLTLTFAQGEQISSVTRVYGAIAFVTAITGVYLGLVSKRD